MKTLILLVTLVSSSASAAEYKVIYIVNGKEVNAAEAIVASMRGNDVMKCQNVEAKASKSGSSIGLRAVKKAKRAE